jgi:GT2 family glycosyltransferase
VTESPSSSVCAVVVTRDRRALLEECLTALRAQSRPVDHVVVVDNASSDGTADMVRERFADVELMRLEHNGGGAGGFHAGMRTAYDAGFEWLWLMDDDTIASPTALERLLEPLDRLDGLPRPAILASRVEWTDGDLHPKNLPFPRVDDAAKATLVEAAGAGLLLIRAATFVSILVHRDAIAAHGLPHEHYFIWGDDGEFTARVLRDGAGYLVPSSVVHHKTAEKQGVHRAGSPQYYFEVRNKLFMLRGGSWTPTEKVKLAIGMLVGVAEYLRAARMRPSALAVLARAVRDGLTRPAE